jgi:hypothetical protein
VVNQIVTKVLQSPRAVYSKFKTVFNFGKSTTTVQSSEQSSQIASKSDASHGGLVGNKALCEKYTIPLDTSVDQQSNFSDTLVRKTESRLHSNSDEVDEENNKSRRLDSSFKVVSTLVNNGQQSTVVPTTTTTGEEEQKCSNFEICYGLSSLQGFQTQLVSCLSRALK